MMLGFRARNPRWEPGMGMDPRFWQIGDGRGVGMIPDPRQIGDGTPIHIPGQIGDGDGDGDRGFRTLATVRIRRRHHGGPLVAGSAVAAGASGTQAGTSAARLPLARGPPMARMVLVGEAAPPGAQAEAARVVTEATQTAAAARSRSGIMVPVAQARMGLPWQPDWR